MRSVFGLDPHSSGEILMEGKPIQIRCVRDAIKNDIVMATESRKDDGLVLCRSVEENIMLPSLYPPSRFGILNVKENHRVARRGVQAAGGSRPAPWRPWPISSPAAISRS